MRQLLVGITYDLREEYLAMGFDQEDVAEFDRPETITALENALGAHGCRTEKIGNIVSLVERLARGERWDLVFNIAEGLWGFGREAQIPALLEAYRIPVVFSDSLVLALTLHKGLTKRIVRDLGIATPDFAIVESPHELSSLTLAFPLFVKPVAEGTSKGIDASSLITNKESLIATGERLLTRFRQPLLVERYLPGREFTVGILETGEESRMAGAMEVLLNQKAEQGVYSWKNKEHFEDLVEYRPVSGKLAEKLAAMALAIWRGLGCRDAGRLDFRQDERGELSFIEINPLPGLDPTHSDLPILCRLSGINYGELIGTILISALKRRTASGLPAPPGMGKTLR